jgi:hypothetical protein
VFLETSRYYHQRTTETTAGDGRPATAITLRRLPATKGTPATISSNDRLDIIAQRRYGNPTMFWHVADANSELQANELTRTAGRDILIPEH